MGTQQNGNLGGSHFQSEASTLENCMLKPYLALISGYTGLANELGFSIEPTKDDKIFFLALPEAMQRQTVANLELLVSIFLEARKAGENLLDDKRLLWRIISQLGYRPASDLFSHVTDMDMIEVYDAQTNVQIYRSFRFFAHCSYTLDELLCRPWWELYRREEFANEGIMACIARVLSPENQGTVYYNVDPYLIEEIDSQRRFKWIAHSRCLSPLFDGVAVRAAINIVRAIDEQK